MRIGNVRRTYAWTITVLKMPKYGVFPGPYFPGLNTGKYGHEKTPYLDTFHTVNVTKIVFVIVRNIVRKYCTLVRGE